MNYTFEKAEKSTVKITMSFDSTEWAEAQKVAYNKVKGKYSVPGFRKGKAPMKVLTSYYGEGIFFEQAVNDLFNDNYYSILEKEPTIDAISQPDVDLGKFDETGIEVIAIVAVKPEVKLGDYKGIKFEKQVYNVKESDIEEEIERLRERNSRMVEVSDRPAQNGDIVNINYSGSVAGVKFEGGTAENQQLELGSNSFIPGFEDQVVGMNIGEDRDINVKFPEEYHAEDLKGKDAVFAIKLNKIEVKELPEINDEFIKDATGFESLEEYKAKTKERLETQNHERSDRELENKIVEEISKKVEVEIPDALVERQCDNMVQEFEYRLMYQGLKMADYLKYTGQTVEAMKEGYKAKAAETVKQQLTINKIIEVEALTATEEEVEKRLEEMAQKQNRPVPEVKDKMNAKQLDYIKDEIIIKKLFDMLKGANEIVEVEAK